MPDLHSSIVDASHVVNVVAPVTPFWAVVQAITGLNDDETAAEKYGDWIFPVQALGTISHITVNGEYHMTSGAFLVADPITGSVVWLRRRCNRIKPGTDFQKTIARVFFVDKCPEHGDHPCPHGWGDLTYAVPHDECDIFH